MENRQLFALGTYTALGGPGIRVFALENGKMSPLYDVYVEDPIWLELSADGRHLYAACGGEGPAEGFVASFAPADGDYAKGLVPEARREAHGVCPCHLCVAGGDLISANYADGCVSVFPLEDGVPGEMSQQLRHHGRGPHPLRQVCAHVHQVLPLGENAFQAQDLGIDRLVRYAKRDGQWVKTAEIPVHSGDGPRHALVNGGVMYLLTELSSWLRVYRMEGDTLREIQALKLPGDDFPATNYPAAIRLSPDRTVLMVSCRGADAVAFFRVAPDGTVTPDGWAAVHGCWPRDIRMLDYGTLLCASQKSGDVSLLRRAGAHLEVLDAMRLPGPVALLPLQI